MLDREQALALLNELGPEKHLIQHALASEAVMRALARHLGEDEEVWGLTGLLHDLDYPLTHEDPAKHGPRRSRTHRRPPARRSPARHPRP